MLRERSWVDFGVLERVVSSCFVALEERSCTAHWEGWLVYPTAEMGAVLSPSVTPPSFHTVLPHLVSCQTLLSVSLTEGPPACLPACTDPICPGVPRGTPNISVTPALRIFASSRMVFRKPNLWQPVRG